MPRTLRLYSGARRKEFTFRTSTGGLCAPLFRTPGFGIQFPEPGLNAFSAIGIQFPEPGLNAFPAIGIQFPEPGLNAFPAIGIQFPEPGLNAFPGFGIGFQRLVET